MPKDKNNSTGNKSNGPKKTNFVQAAVSLGMSLYNNKERIGENISKIYSNIYGEEKEFNLHEVKTQFSALGRLAKAYSKGEYREISPATFFKVATAIAYA